MPQENSLRLENINQINTRWYHKLGGKVLALILSTGVLIAIAEMLFFQWIVYEKLDEDTFSLLKKKQASLNQHLFQQRDNLNDLASSLSKDINLAKLLYNYSINGERAELVRYFKTVYDSSSINYLTVYLPNNKVIYRGHNIQSHGDIEADNWLKNSLGNNALPLAGFVINKKGVNLRSRVNIILEGDLIASIEMGNYINTDFLQNLKQLHQVDISIYNHTSFIATSFNNNLLEAHVSLDESINTKIANKQYIFNKTLFNKTPLVNSYFSSPLPSDANVRINIKMSVDNSTSQRIEAQLKSTSIIFIFVISIILINVSLFFIRTVITSPLKRLMLQLKNLAVGKLATTETINATDELAGIAEMVNRIILNTREVIDETKAISLGDYSSDIKMRSEQDELVMALLKMTNELRSTSHDNERQNWVKNGVATLSDRLIGSTNLTIMGNTLLSFLADYLNIQIGVFYTTATINKEKIIEMKASYAFTEKNKGDTQYKFGEGIIGQAALERRSFIISDVPQGYCTIHTSLTEINCCNLLVEPIIFDNDVEGVLELGKLSEFTEIESSFLKRVIEVVGASINAVQSRIQVEEKNEEIKTTLNKLEKRTSELEVAKQTIEQTHKKIEDSIKYSSLIQKSIIPAEQLFYNNFTEHFIIWQPRDLIGGDIYLLDSLRSGNECLLMVVDCTGHGVPGAFVTMLVKAIERQVIGIIKRNDSMTISPGWILSYFNKMLKKLLRQEDNDSISNAGFDGGIILYNKKNNIIRYAGAELPMFYIQNGKFNTIKGDRVSVGYRTSHKDYQFNDHELKIDCDTYIYLTTDGYIDQNGGNKGFPLGKKKLKHSLLDIHLNSFSSQKEVLLNKLSDYKRTEDTTDDVTMVGLKIKPTT